MKFFRSSICMTFFLFSSKHSPLSALLSSPSSSSGLTRGSREQTASGVDPRVKPEDDGLSKGRLRSYFAQILLALSLLIPSHAHAHAHATETDTSLENPKDSVFVFNRICYSQVPSIKNIRKFSTQLGWNPMGGEDLKRFTTIDDPAVLEGWDVLLSGRIYRLGVVQGEPAEGMKTSFPDFAEGIATSCTLILDGDDQAGDIIERMQILARKEPLSTNVPEGELFTTTWAGGNEDFKVFLFFKADKARRGNLLNVTILAKE